MDALEHLAKQAWANHIIGASLKRNALIKPFDMLLEALEESPRPEDRECVRAATVEEIFAHLERINASEYKLGRTKREAVKEYVRIFFDELLDGRYHGDVNRLLDRSRMLRSAYLFHVREQIPLRAQEQGNGESGEEERSAAAE